MIDFKRLELSDKAKYDNYLMNCGERGCEYSFVNLFLWGRQKAAFVNDFLVVQSQFDRRCVYPFPVGQGDVAPVLDAIIADARERGIPCCLTSLTAAECDLLERRYPGRFRFHPIRDNFDYVYHIERLTELKGKKLQSKRNHCNRFVDAWPDYRVLPLTPERIDDCRAFTARWYEEHAAFHDPSDYDGERVAIEKAFRHFDALHMEGIILETAEGMVGFSMGNRIREDTFDVNYEKALAQVNGAYPMVNREFARRIQARYPEVRYLNREDDMGIEGLRRAKESYFPDILLEKWIGEEKTT